MFIYLHVPFCASKCIYCDFYVELAKYGGQEAFVQAVCAEIPARFEQFHIPKQPLQGFYVGGGTPSLLPASAYAQIKAALTPFVQWSEETEWTFEVNPLHLANPPEDYRQVGMNRVSVGVQSFQDHELKALSRAHSAEDARACIQALQHGGFDNISIDLMYGIPQQTGQSWQNTLEQAVALNIQHISAYGLKVEPETPLERLKHYPQYHLPDDDDTVDWYEAGVAYLAAHGFDRYEFSNFAKTGRESKHNVNYWQNGFYLALGPGAHGYAAPQWERQQPHCRYENPANLTTYLQNPTQLKPTPCPPHEVLENALIFGLRQTRGLHIPTLEAQYNINFMARYGEILQPLLHPKGLQLDGDTLKLTPEAIPVSNEIFYKILQNE